MLAVWEEDPKGSLALTVCFWRVRGQSQTWTTSWAA